MAAPSPALRLLFLRPALLRPVPFSSRLLVRTYAKKKAPAKAAPKPSTPKAAPTPTPTPAYIPLADQLALSGKRTLLYAKRPWKHLLASYGLATACVWAAVESYDGRIANPAAELPTWAKGCTWVSIAFYVAIAAFFAWRPSRIVEKIYAVPIKGATPSIRLELHRRSVLPGAPFKKIDVGSPSRATLLQPLQLEKAPEAKGVFAKIYGAPGRMVSAAKKFLYADMFSHLRVEGRAGTYLLHKDPYLWEKRGLERLLPKNVKVTRF